MAGKRKNDATRVAEQTNKQPHATGAPSEENQAHNAPLNADNVTKPQNTVVALHRSKCWDYKPHAIVAVASCPASQLLAVGLESGDLELWDLGFMSCLQRIVAFNTEVTALAWVKDSLTGAWRTFAAALDGSIAEVNWKQGTLVAATDSGAGAVWSLSAQPADSVRAGFAHLVAAGCDDGTVRMFSVEGGEPGLMYERTVSRQEGRVLSVTWASSGAVLVAAGADGCIHVMDAVTGAESMRITASSTTAQPVCVWRVLVLPDNTIVSGDSSGAVQFWDGAFGSLLQRFTIHSADILALAMSPDGHSVWASGVDSQVAMFERCGADSSGLIGTTGGSSRNASQWVYTHYKRPHTHDVRAMDVVNPVSGTSAERAMLVTGGADAQLMVYPCTAFLKVHPARLTKCPQAPMCRLTNSNTPSSTAVPNGLANGVLHSGEEDDVQQADRLLCAHNDTLDVWQLATTVHQQAQGGLMNGRYHHQQQHAAQGSPHHGDTADLISAPRHIARIQVAAGRVRCADISPGSSHVACIAGSESTVRVYALQEPSTANQGLPNGLTNDHSLLSLSTATVSRVGFEGGAVQGTSVTVSKSHVFVGQHDGKVQVYQLPTASQPDDSEDVDDEVKASKKLRLVGKCNAWSDIAVSNPALQSIASLKQSARKNGHWSQHQPSITCMCTNTDGSLLAVSGPQGLSCLRIQEGDDGSVSLEHVWTKPFKSHHDAPASQICFNHDATLIAAALSNGHLVVVDAVLGRPTQWCLDNDSAVATCLSRLPGTPQGIAFSRSQATPNLLLVHSAGGFCAIDVASPMPSEEQLSQKRRRTSAKPTTGGPVSVAGAGPVMDVTAGSSGADRSSSHAKDSFSQGNGKALLLSDSVAFVGFAQGNHVLVLEKPWEEVLAGMAPPLFRPRYGN